MAASDIVILSDAGFGMPGTQTYQTEAGATAILAGEPVKVKTAGSRYVIPLADAEPVIGTTTAVVGIASTTSTHTASADGKINVFIPVSGVTYIAKAKSAAAVDTQAEYDALVGKRVVIDLTSGSYTVDTAAADNAANGLLIKQMDINTYPGKVAFELRGSGTILN